MPVTSPFRAAHDERGSAMVAVVGLMCITVIIGISVATASIGALGFTSSTRAGVQSQAAAEAGIDYTVGALKSTMACSATYTSPAGSPAFSTSISYATTATIPSGAAGWTPGCPVNSATFVRIESVGTAKAKGVAGNTIGDKNKVEAIFNYVSAHVPVTATGSAAYSYSTGVLNNLTLLDGGNLNSDIRIKTGSVDCQSGTVINGSVRLANGSFQSSGSCRVTGSVSASQYVAVNSGSSIGGDIVAGGADLYHTTAVTAVGTGQSSNGGGKAVGGNIMAGGPVRIEGVVGGNVTSTRLPNGTVGAVSVITPDATTRVGGNLAASGAFDTWAPRCTTPGETGWDAAGNRCAIKKNGNVIGAVSHNVGGLSAPAAPVVPNWVDYAFNPADWTALGYTVVTWPNTNEACRIDQNTALLPRVTALSTYTTPTVIDARQCASGVDFSQSSALNLNLKTDIAFVATKFDIGRVLAKSNNATTRKMWFIVPDLTANTQPTATAANCYVDIKNDTRIENTVAAFVYTPCKITNSAAQWSGQMYGGTVEFNTNIQLTFEPVGLPNVDLDGGPATPPAGGSTGGLGSRLSIRDVATT
jgi:hypothetical protein